MAVWQFHFELVPGEANERRTSEASEPSPDWTLDSDRTERLVRRLDTLLAERESWSKKVRLWGPEDGTRVDLVVTSEGLAEEITVRLDMRSAGTTSGSAPLAGICAFAGDLGLVVLTTQGQLLPPEVGLVLRLALDSGARRFVDDPRKFLDHVAQKLGSKR